MGAFVLYQVHCNGDGSISYLQLGPSPNIAHASSLSDRSFANGQHLSSTASRPSVYGKPVRRKLHDAVRPWCPEEVKREIPLALHHGRKW